MFLPLTICKLTQQRLRGSWGQSTKNNNSYSISIITSTAVFVGKKVYRQWDFFPTQSSRSYLDKLPIEVGNDSITLLGRVHPDGEEDKTTMTHH